MTVNFYFLATVLSGGAGVGVGVDENNQTGDAGESATRIIGAVEGEAEFLLNAESEFELIEGVEAKVASNKRNAVGNGLRVGDVRSEEVGNEMLQARRQQVLLGCVVIHPATIRLQANIRHGV